MRLDTPYDPALNDTDSQEFHLLAEAVCHQVKSQTMLSVILCKCSVQLILMGSVIVHMFLL